MNYNGPDKIEGSHFTPEEHNQMKAAINSKLDASNIVTDPSAAPGNGSVFSTGAVQAMIQNIIGSGVLYKGELTGGEDLNDPSFAESGFWISKEDGFNSTGNQSVPVPLRGIVITYGNNVSAIQQFIAFNNETSSFIRNYAIISNQWSGWREMASTQFVNSTYAPKVPLGNPTIFSPDGVDVIASESSDLKGLLTVINNTGATLDPGTNVTITFEFQRSGLSAITFGYKVGNSSSFNVVAYSQPSNIEAVIRINSGMAAGESGSFFYLIQ